MKNYQEILNCLKNQLNEERYAHSLRVEKTAIRLAKIYACNLNHTRIAALLHDVAKDKSNQQLLSLAIKNHLPISPIERDNPKLLHGPISALIAKRDFDITNKAILSAIACHTTGKVQMSLLDKIIFLADHVEPWRDYPEVKTIRRLAKNNINKAIIKSLVSMVKYLLENKKTICLKTIETLNYFINYEIK